VNIYIILGCSIDPSESPDERLKLTRDTTLDIIAVLTFRGNAAMVMYGRREQRPACTTLRWSCDGCLKTEVGVEDIERCAVGENRASMTQIFSSGILNVIR